MIESIVQTIQRAKMGDPNAMMDLITLLKPLLVRSSIVDGKFDEDLYQFLTMKVMAATKEEFNI